MNFVSNFPTNNDRTVHAGGVPGGADGSRTAEEAAYQEVETDSSSNETLPGGSRSTSHNTGYVGKAGDSKEANEARNVATDDQVHNLARAASRMSTTSHNYGDEDPFQDTKNPRLDPNSPSFSARAYAEAVLKVHSKDRNAVPMRRAGVAFRDLNVHGYGADSDYQKTVSNAFMSIGSMVTSLLGNKGREIKILQEFNGLVRSGEMLVVLGPPGSGCSTLLKTISGETHGFYVDDKSYLNYQGIDAKHMQTNFRGENIYSAEVDVHFPQLTVGETLAFAAEARAPRSPLSGLTKKQYAEHARDVIMAIFGISHTINTRVGNDFLRGVSGGERKRVSIAEACLSGAPLQCWDNSTRGLDSANAIEFCKTLRVSADLSHATALVAIYQAPASAYEVFDKVTVLYEGRQIYFGPIHEAEGFFSEMGFDKPGRQTVPDFLTSLTSPQERRAKAGFEQRVPRTPDEFAQRWKESDTYRRLLAEIDEFDRQYPVGGQALEDFKESRRAQQAKGARATSPYTLSYRQQVQLCLRRGFWRLKADPSLMVTQLLGNFIFSLIIASIFYNLSQDTASFFSRGSLLFFAILNNAFGAALEILTLYAQRPIVEKHSRYALYHPSAEAWASMLTDMPAKVGNALVTNITLYFMTNLRREPGPFFFFLLTAFLLTLCMSMIFRTIASASRTFTGAMTPTTVLMLGLVIFTGFAIPVTYMRGWSRWINYLNPIGYGFESLMINEFAGQFYECSVYVPSGDAYAGIAGVNRVCSAVSAVPGQTSISGTAYIASAYNYQPSHKWRNIGIIIAELVFFLLTYMLFAETVAAAKSKGEVLVFKRRDIKAQQKVPSSDIETGFGKGSKQAEVLQEKVISRGEAKVPENLVKQTAIFHWEDVCYDIKIKKEDRRILDHVDGWVKPGQLTALMGVSGAGKTTLLDVLATRVTMGVVTGDMLVDGRPRDASFQRKTGYAQQQDIHLETATVREALEFSALLRQPAHIPKAEKLAYVDEVIELLDMQAYAGAVVGVPGTGLNVEQRKRLTIGVELAAKPSLLLFLDEPTSGLDSQTSWAIADLMEKLTNAGQAILCTIHQPSSILFERFDRLLFLAKGGKTVYFGEVGKDSHILNSYFERQGGKPCPPGANPAEFMLENIGAAPGSTSEIDWPKAWRESQEYREVKQELARLRDHKPVETEPLSNPNDKESLRPFAASWPTQFAVVTRRIFQQYWRTPSYIYAKFALVAAAALFVGFSFFNMDLSQQGLQNQLFSVFMIFIIFSQLVQQILPTFVTARSVYEAKERPAKTYHWSAFMLSNIVAEIPWALLLGTVMFFAYYYPVGMYRNAVPNDQVALRGAVFWLYCIIFILYSSTFAHLVIAAIDTAETAGNIGNLMFSMCLLFCGVLAGPDQLPGFWIFMYRCSPFAYMVSGMLATGLAGNRVTCAQNEYVNFQPAGGATCEAYLQPYIQAAGGYLNNPQSTTDCEYCAIESTDVFLNSINASYSNVGRNAGICVAFIFINIIGACGLYWLARVPKKPKQPKEKKE